MLRAFQRALLTTCHGTHQRRGFFNFTKYPFPNPLPQSGPETNQTYHEHKIFPYRRSELYKVVSDVESYPNFVPYCTDSKILRSAARRDGITMMEAELTVGFLAFKESYTSTVTCKPHEFVEAVASSSSPLFKTLTTVWHLKPVSPFSPQHSPSYEPKTPVTNSAFLDQGPTLVTLDLAFAFANPMHAAVSATFFGQVSKLMVKAFEQRCVALYGTRND